MKKYKGKRLLALLLAALMTVTMLPGLPSDAVGARTLRDEPAPAGEVLSEAVTEPAETEAPETEAVTEAPETEAPETEAVTEAPETEAPETEAVTEAPETEAVTEPAGTEAPETQAPVPVRPAPQRNTANALRGAVPDLDGCEVSYAVGEWGGVDAYLVSAPEGANLVLPETVTVDGKEYPVVGLVGSLSEYEKLGSLTVPDTVRYVNPMFMYGNNSSISVGSIMNWKGYKDLGTNSNLYYRYKVIDFPELYHGTMSASLTINDPDPADIPAFIKNHYDADGAYYAGKCLVRVDPAHQGDFTVKDGTICVLAGAFADCTGLGKVTLPDSVEYIGVAAFAGSSVTSVNIPAGMNGKNLEKDTFAECEKLTTVDIQCTGIECIVHGCFYDCAALTGFDFSKVALIQSETFIQAFDPSAGVAIDLSKTSVFTYGFREFALSGIKEVYLPDVEHIGTGAFAGCPKLDTIHWSPNVRRVGTSTFEGCTSLASDVLADPECQVTQIEFRAFAKTGLTEITFPERMTSIGAGCVAECPSLETVNMNANFSKIAAGQFFAIVEDMDKGGFYTHVSSYADDTFANLPDKTGRTAVRTINIGSTAAAQTMYARLAMMPYLEKVTFSVPVQYFDSHALFGCVSLKTVELAYPEALQRVGYEAFAWTGLEETVVMKGVVYDYMVFQNCINLKKVVVEEGVDRIWEFLFEGCTSLNQVAVPRTVRRINWAAFKNTATQTIFEVLGDNPAIKDYEEADWPLLMIPNTVGIIEDDAFANSYGMDFLVEGDPMVEKYSHRSYYYYGYNDPVTAFMRPQKVYSNAAVENGTQFGFYIKGIPDWPFGKPIIKPYPVTLEVTGQPMVVQEGDEKIDVSHLKIYADGKLLAEGTDYELDYDLSGKKAGETVHVNVTFLGDEPMQVLVPGTLSATNFYTTEKTGTIYTLADAAEGFDVEVIGGPSNEILTLTDLDTSNVTDSTCTLTGKGTLARGLMTTPQGQEILRVASAGRIQEITVAEDGSFEFSLDNVSVSEPAAVQLVWVPAAVMKAVRSVAPLINSGNNGAVLDSVVIPFVELTVTKHWKDEKTNDHAADAVTVTLVADGEETDKQVALTKVGQWTDVFRGLPLFTEWSKDAEPVPVVYTAKETAINGYRIESEATSENVEVRFDYGQVPESERANFTEKLIVVSEENGLALSAGDDSVSIVAIDANDDNQLWSVESGKKVIRYGAGEPKEVAGSLLKASNGRYLGLTESGFVLMPENVELTGVGDTASVTVPIDDLLGGKVFTDYAYPNADYDWTAVLEALGQFALYEESPVSGNYVIRSVSGIGVRSEDGTVTYETMTARYDSGSYAAESFSDKFIVLDSRSRVVLQAEPDGTVTAADMDLYNENQMWSTDDDVQIVRYEWNGRGYEKRVYPGAPLVDHQGRYLTFDYETNRIRLHALTDEVQYDYLQYNTQYGYWQYMGTGTGTVADMLDPSKLTGDDENMIMFFRYEFIAYVKSPLSDEYMVGTADGYLGLGYKLYSIFPTRARINMSRSRSFSYSSLADVRIHGWDEELNYGRVSDVNIHDLGNGLSYEVTNTPLATVTVKKYLRDSEQDKLYPVDKETFYVALFADEAKTKLAAGPMVLTVEAASSGTVVFEGLEPGVAYYLAETDSTGAVITDGKLSDGTSFTVRYDTEKASPTLEEIEAELTLTNVVTVPEEILEPDTPLGLNGSVKVTKTLENKTEGGAFVPEQKTTFYVSLFADEACTVRIGSIQSLVFDGTSTASVSFKDLPNGTYYVAETNASGQALVGGMTDDGLAYTVEFSDGQKVTVSTGTETALTFTNVVEQKTPLAPEEGGKTWDTTPLGRYLAILLVSLAGVIICLVYSRKRRVR